MSGFSLTLNAGTAERDALIAELWELGTTGITEEDAFLRAFFSDEADRASLLRQFAEYHPALEEQDDYDWVKHSQSLWRPFAVGERFWLAPEWETEPAPDGRLRLPIRPGLASGSGSHPATQLCLEALERTVQPGASVLDVGTGSGILTQAAGLLGAERVVACDIDHEATIVAHRNLPELPLFTGSLRSVRDGAFDIAVANLNAISLSVVADDLARVARTGIVSGFRQDEAARVEGQTKRPTKETQELDDWICFIF